MKKIKIILGDFAYLYHGELRIDELTKFISQFTQMYYLIKWKDQNDDMITIFRQNDLIYCHQICLRENICLKLYILEKKGQQTQLVSDPLISQENVQKNREIIPQIVVSQENCLSLITLGQQRNQQQQRDIIHSTEINKNFTTDDEKKSYCDKIVMGMMEEIYPGLKKFLQNSLTKSHSIQPLQPDQIEIKRFQSQYQNKSIGYPQQMEQSLIFQQDSDDEPISNQQQFLKKQESIQIQLDNTTPEQMTPKMNKENQNEDQLFFCDFCSEIIETKALKYICTEPECQDLHYCDPCFQQYKKEFGENHIITEMK